MGSMEGLRFVKMEGAGNDFILIDDREGRFEGERGRELARKLCTRRLSVGADGLILIAGSDSADFRMRIINPDGSEPEMCGNGSRCAAMFARKLGACGDELTIEALGGPVEAEVRGERVRVELSRPGPISRLEIDGNEVYSVNTMVPHAVVFVEDLEETDVFNEGRRLRYHAAFGDPGTNVDFVEVEGEGEVEIRTYERGVEAETLACGTGAAASALVSAYLRSWKGPVEVRVRSKEVLRIEFEGSGPRFGRCFLEGSVREVFAGEIA